MSRTAYNLLIADRIKQIRNIANNTATPNSVGYLDWNSESNGYNFFKVANTSGGITVLRRTSSKRELLDYLDGLFAGYQSALMANEKSTPDAWCA